MKKIVVCVLLTLMLCFLAQPLVQVLPQVQALPLVQVPLQVLRPLLQLLLHM